MSPCSRYEVSKGRRYLFAPASSMACLRAAHASATALLTAAASPFGNSIACTYRSLWLYLRQMLQEQYHKCQSAEHQDDQAVMALLRPANCLQQSRWNRKQTGQKSRARLQCMAMLNVCSGRHCDLQSWKQLLRACAQHCAEAPSAVQGSPRWAAAS